jgi:translocation and assembly module TamB
MVKLRSAGKIAGGGILTLPLALALAFGLAQTEAGKKGLAAALGHWLSDPEEEVAIRGIGGLVPFDMTLGSITLADRQGPRVVVSDAAITIAPAGLLAGRLALAITAREVRVDRTDEGGGTLGALLHLPLRVKLERLQIDRIALGAAVLGEPVALTLAASGAVGGGSAAADLDLHRIDGMAGAARLHLALGGEPMRLDLAGEVAEPSGRLLADVLGSSEKLPLAIHVAGAGPLADWRGRLEASAGKEAALALDVEVRDDGGYRITGDGTARVSPLLQPPLQPLFAGETRFSAAIEVARASLALESLHAAAAAGTVSAAGSYARDSTAISATATLDAPDLAMLGPILGADMRGALRASLALDGTRTTPRAHLALEGDGIGIDGNGAARTTAAFDLGAAGDPLTASTPIDISGTGRLSRLTFAYPKFPAALGNDLDWRIGARLERAAQRATLSELTLADAGSTLTAQGSLERGAVSGKAHLALADIATLAGASARGALALDADLHGSVEGAGTLQVSGTLRPESGDASMLAALVGAEGRLTATLERRADGSLAARDIGFTGANGHATAAASRAADGAIVADFRLDLPQLAALDPRLEGDASLSGDLAGRADAISGKAVLEANAIGAGPLHLDRFEARLAVPDLAQGTGQIDASFHARDLAGTATAEGALAPDELRLSRLRLEAGGTRLEGNLAFRPTGSTLEGTLDATVPDLSPWSALVGTPVAGTAKLKAAFAGTKGQTLELALDGSRLSWGPEASATLQLLHASARLSDLFGKPQGRAALQVDNAKLGAVSVARLRLDGSSDRPGRFALRGESRGDAGGSFDVAGDSIATLGAERIELRVTRLAGTVAGQQVLLTRPLLLTRRGADLGFADLALNIGKGEIGGTGSTKGDALSLHLLAQKLPVDTIAAFAGAKDVGGELGFEVTLRGTRQRPQGDLVLDGEELRFAAASHPDLPPLGMVASAAWRGDQVQIKGRLAGPQDTAVGVTGSVPLLLDPRSLAPRLPPTGRLAFHFEGEGQLADIVDLLPLGEDRLAGQFTVDVSVTGTVASPVASGRFTLRNGRYESLVFGTVLAGVSFDLVGDRDRLVVQSFAAGDGEGGTLALTGSVNLAASAGPSLDFSGRLKSFRVVRRDEATGRASGELRLSGSLAQPRLGGALRIEAAELRVPERLPQDVQPISVIKIDSATGETLSTPEGKAQPWLAVALDLAIDMPGQVFVRGRGLDSEWRGKLAVAGTTAALRLTGRLEVVRGTYDFLGKTATLTRGAINFIGGAQRIDPAIDIEAQLSSTDIVALVRIGGTALQPKIALSSQPELPQDEILSRVLFGASVSQISAAQGLEIAQAAAALASGGGLGVVDRIRQGLGLDRLSLGSASRNAALSTFTAPSLASTPGVPGSQPSNGVGASPLPIGAASSGSSTAAGAAAVSAGKYVANGVYVGVTQGITAGSSSVDVQINATRHITVDTTAGQTSGAGVGINWKLDY